MLLIIPLLIGYIADLLLGDPHHWPHPVKVFGYLISKGTTWLNQDRGRFVKGMLLTLTLCAATYLLFYYSLITLRRWWLPAWYIVSSSFVFFGLANKGLLKEGQEVFDTLDKEGLEAGRKRLSWIVGRDTASLTPNQIRIAVLESMSENLSDGVIAPLFFYLIGGVPAMMLYKMINTLDSMIGYRREPYRLFGRFAARLDDIANFIPARLTALLMVLITGSQRGLKFIFRYGHAHASPNSGYPEAALAGILNCRFGGPNTYGGIKVEKPYIGENNRDINSSEFIFVKYINHAVTALVVLLSIIYFIC